MNKFSPCHKNMNSYNQAKQKKTGWEKFNFTADLSQSLSFLPS